MTLWLIVLPLVDYYRAPDEPESAALKMLFLRICLFAAYGSCFETQFTQLGAQWLILIAPRSGCGSSRSRASRDRPRQRPPRVLSLISN